MPLLDVSQVEEQATHTTRKAGTNSSANSSQSTDDAGRTPLHIVHIVKHCCYANGNVHVAVDLACEQAKLGDTVTFISRGGTFEPLLERYGVKHVHMPHEQNSPRALIKAAWWLARYSRREHPDILHAHMMASALIGYAASRVSGVPLVTTVHNSFDRHSAIMRLGDRIIAVSRAERDVLLRKGYDPRRVVAIMNAPNKSPREGFLKDDEPVVLQSPCILAANGLHRRKGVFDLIEACSKLFPSIPNWHLYIAGEGPDREILEKQVRDAGLTHRVQFLGFRGNPKPLMEQADIFVLASYADPCSLAIGEARSSGCVVVGTSVGGTPEMLEYGKAGCLVSPGNTEELAETLRSLMIDPAKRLQLRQAALKGAEIFDVNRLVGDYDAVYRNAIANPRG